MIDRASSGAHGEQRRIGATRDGGRWSDGDEGTRGGICQVYGPVPMTSAWRNSHERCTSAWRNSYERCTSVIREITRDHVKKNFPQGARNLWKVVDRETVACRAFATWAPSGQRPPTLRKPSTDLAGLAMVWGGDYLDIVFNRNSLAVAVKGRDRAAPLPVRRAPIMGRTHRALPAMGARCRRISGPRKPNLQHWIPGSLVCHP